MDKEKIIADEVKRLTDEFHKSFLNCEDIMRLTGLGRDNVRRLMKENKIETKQIGRRQVVSILQFVMWQYGETEA